MALNEQEIRDWAAQTGLSYRLNSFYDAFYVYFTKQVEDRNVEICINIQEETKKRNAHTDENGDVYDLCCVSVKMNWSSYSSMSASTCSEILTFYAQVGVHAAQLEKNLTGKEYLSLAYTKQEILEQNTRYQVNQLSIPPIRGKKVHYFDLTGPCADIEGFLKDRKYKFTVTGNRVAISRV